MKEIGELGNSNSSEGFLAFFSPHVEDHCWKVQDLDRCFFLPCRKMIVLKLDHRKLTNGYQKLRVLENVSPFQMVSFWVSTWSDVKGLRPLLPQASLFFLLGGAGTNNKQGCTPEKSTWQAENCWFGRLLFLLGCHLLRCELLLSGKVLWVKVTGVYGVYYGLLLHPVGCNILSAILGSSGQQEFCRKLER